MRSLASVRLVTNMFLAGTGAHSTLHTIRQTKLDLQGLFGGRCRAPLATPGGDAIEEIKEALATAGLL